MRLSQVALALVPALATAAPPSSAGYPGPSHHGRLSDPGRGKVIVHPNARKTPAPEEGTPHSGGLASADPQILPLSQVRVGMKGYGLTVFHGTKIDRFGFEVLGVLPKLNLGQPYILVRLTNGGPIISRGAFLIHGMSGSPCYINGRLMGAFSAGEP